MPRSLALWIAFTGWGAVFALAVLLAAVVLRAPRDASAVATPSASASATAPQTIEIRAFDLGFEPAMVHVAAARTYSLRFVNDGGTLHDVTFADGTSVWAEAHSTATGTVEIPATGLSFICSVPGHADAGMRGEVMVTSVGMETPAPSASLTAEQLRDADAARTAQFPAETKGKGNQVLKPTVLKDGTKQWELRASVIQWETEPGKVVEAYAYNETVPRPQIHVNVGDSARSDHSQRATRADDHPLPRPGGANQVDGVPVITPSPP